MGASQQLDAEDNKYNKYSQSQTSRGICVRDLVGSLEVSRSSIMSTVATWV